MSNEDEGDIVALRIILDRIETWTTETLSVVRFILSGTLITYYCREYFAKLDVKSLDDIVCVFE